MKKVIFILFIVANLPGYSQSNTAEIEDYSLGKKDLVLLPFGMDQKIIIGTVDASGQIHFDWSGFDISKLKNTDMFLSDFQSAFGIFCDEEIVEIGSVEGIQMVLGGDFYIYNESFWEGAVIPASSLEMKDHLLDEYGKDAVPGQYLKLVYSSDDALYKATCSAKQTYMSGTEVDLVKQFDLDLKKGWNIVLFEIEEVIPVQDAAATPVKMKMSAINTFPDEMTWFLKKF
jgi:hypothetical protein